MSKHDQIMGALFTHQRLQVLTLGVHHKEYDTGYLYAWAKSVYPIQQDTDGSVPMMPHEHYPEQFKVSKEKVDELTDYLDKCWIDHKVPTFNELESQYKIRETGSEWDRMDLIHICRYMFLSSTFDEEFWNKLLTPQQHPSEAMSIRRDYDRENIYFQ